LGYLLKGYSLFVGVVSEGGFERMLQQQVLICRAS
jgi:hypothetical protein